mmetsp:Transcript_19993/g.41036  ORF Transcript_19993/g.41036 Transcript_19993/m.41036 type:complete len:307 (+) Transcript_19993:25-945(+)
MSRGFQPKNGEIFNKDGHGPKIYNGFGTTRTSQSPTLFVTNLPPSVTMVMLEAVFSLDPGFQQLRTVRHMIFVDYYDIRSSTDAMRFHQNHKFEGHPVDQGIMIDYDKDPRNKRNKAFTGQQERGAYTHGLGHEVANGNNNSAGHYEHQERTGLGMAATRTAPRPRDPTLDLINKIKAEHAADQGVVVSEYEVQRGERRQREKDERATAYAVRRGRPVPGPKGRSSGGAEPEGMAIALPPPKTSAGSSGAAGCVGKLVRKEKKEPKKRKQQATSDTGEGAASISDDASSLPTPKRSGGAGSVMARR